MPEKLDLSVRLRRLRLHPGLRSALQRVVLRRSDIIVPVFVTEGQNVRREVASMPGVFQMSVDAATQYLYERSQAGFAAFLVFGVIDRAKKDSLGSAALDAKNVVCRL